MIVPSIDCLTPAPALSLPVTAVIGQTELQPLIETQTSVFLVSFEKA